MPGAVSTRDTDDARDISMIGVAQMLAAPSTGHQHLATQHQHSALSKPIGAQRRRRDEYVPDISEMNTSTPMKPAVFHILLALADRDSHGYAVMQAVREQSGGRVPLQTGSFYRHLSKLLDGGLVAETARKRADDDPRRGAYYRLTPLGQKALAAEKQRLTDLVAAMGGLKTVKKAP